MNKYSESAVTIVILCAIGAGTYFFLNAFEDMIPGWSDPVIIREDASSLSLLLHNGIWIASENHGEMNIHYSKDGKRWSSYPPPENPPGYPLHEDPQWLHRPNGAIWLVWRPAESRKWFWKCCYAQLVDETFTGYEQLNYLNKDSSPSSSVEDTVLGIRYPSGKWVGVDVEGRTEYTLGVEGLPDQISPYPDCTVVLDDEGTLWAVYTQTSNTFVRTSKDGITWSDPDAIPMGVSHQFFQRQNGEYVFFFIKGYAVYMMRSLNGMEWSDPLLVAAGFSEASLVDAAEADSILWAAFIENNNIFVTWYTDEQYQKDLVRLQNYRTKNGENAISFIFLLGVGWFLFRRSSYYLLTKTNIEETRWKGELSKKVKLLLILPVVLAYFYSFSFGTLCTQWLVPAIAVTAAFVLYCLLKGSKDTLFMVIALFIVTILHWIVALAGCTGF